MAKNNLRVQVNDPTPTAELQPAARPVDTFVMPGNPKPSMQNDFVDLGNALNQIHPEFDQFMVKQKEAMDKTQLEEGVQLFEKNRLAFKDAVDKGVIPAGANPHLARGYRLGELRLQSRDADAEMRMAYDQSPLKNNDDPKAVSAFADQFMQKWSQDHLQGHNSSEITEAFYPQARQSVDNLVSHHVAFRVAANEQKAEETLQAQYTASIHDTLETGGSVDTLGSIIKQRTDEAIKNGLNATKANKLAVDSVAEMAEMYGRADLLKALDNIETAPGSSLAKTTYAVKRIDTASKSIQQYRWAMEDHAQKQADRAREENLRVSTDKFAAALAKDRSVAADPVGWAKANGYGGNAAIVQHLLTFGNAVSASQDKITADPASVRTLYNDMIHDPVGFDVTRITAGMGTKWDVNTGMKMIDDWRSQRTARENPWTSGPTVSSMRELLKTGIMGQLGSQFYKPEYANDAANATIEFDLGMSRWLKEHPNSTESEFLEAQQKSFNDIAGRFKHTIEAPGDATATSPSAPAKQPAPTPAQAPKEPSKQMIDWLRANYAKDQLGATKTWEKNLPGVPLTPYLE